MKSPRDLLPYQNIVGKIPVNAKGQRLDIYLTEPSRPLFTKYEPKKDLEKVPCLSTYTVHAIRTNAPTIILPSTIRLNTPFGGREEWSLARNLGCADTHVALPHMYARRWNAASMKNRPGNAT
jgi:hypothetical protein